MEERPIGVDKEGFKDRPEPVKASRKQPPTAAAPADEVDEVKQAADEAAKAAQEAAKAAAEASQSLMKGMSSIGGAFGFGGGNNKQQSGGFNLGGFGFGGSQSSQAKKPPQTKKPPAQKSGPVIAKQQKPLDNQGDPKILKPCTHGMNARERWKWAYRKIQQVILQLYR